MNHQKKNKLPYIIHSFGLGGLLLLIVLRMLVVRLPNPRHQPTHAPTSAEDAPKAILTDSTKQRLAATSVVKESQTVVVTGVPAALSKTDNASALHTQEDPQKNTSAPTKPIPKTIYTRTPQKVSVELNTADTTELQKLYGIGSYYARKIIEYRELLGGYSEVEQLLEIQGIDVERFEKFSLNAFTDTTYIVPLDLKTATEDQLAQHPYIGRYMARNIIRYRNLMGAEQCQIDLLLQEKIITQEQLQKLHPYLK